MRAAILASATLLALAPAFAQTAAPPAMAPTRELPQDRGYDKHTPRHDAVDAAEAPVTANLNGQVAAGTTRDAAAEAQYQSDRAAYREAVAVHAAHVVHDKVRYERQQLAYADAMAAWRMQVAACEEGRKEECRNPEPDPASFY